MSEMIKNVAKALMPYAERLNDEFGDGRETDMQVAEAMARLAIAAMRAPTPPMIAAGEEGVYNNYFEPEIVWPRMIDAALTP